MTKKWIFDGWCEEKNINYTMEVKGELGLHDAVKDVQYVHFRTDFECDASGKDDGCRKYCKEFQKNKNSVVTIK